MVAVAVNRLGQSLGRRFNALLHVGWQLHCPICGYRARTFIAAGHTNRQNAKCPNCFGLERHRLDWLFMKRRTNLFDGTPKRLLHVAPEHVMRKRFQRLPGVSYLSADLDSAVAMEHFDLTSIPYAESSFDVIYCSHVLEHIPDDRKAMRELFRVLSPGGWAILNVPIIVEKSWEDLSITDPALRLRHFGQVDHVRACGPDYVERIRDAGFDAECIRTSDVVSAAEEERIAVPSNQIIFFARRPT